MGGSAAPGPEPTTASGKPRVVAAPQGPPGLFAPEDWACPSCGNMNWARRGKCNMCGTSKPGRVGCYNMHASTFCLGAGRGVPLVRARAT